MRDVSIDEVFTWGEDFGYKAKEAFGSHHCECSPNTFRDLKLRCDEVERRENPFFEPRPVPFNGVQVHVVYSGIPDGILRSCDCARSEVK
jgi:hypothetical protein